MKQWIELVNERFILRLFIRKRKRLGFFGMKH